jgi:hypothetical protein
MHDHLRGPSTSRLGSTWSRNFVTALARLNSLRRLRFKMVPAMLVCRLRIKVSVRVRYASASLTCSCRINSQELAQVTILSAYKLQEVMRTICNQQSAICNAVETERSNHHERAVERGMQNPYGKHVPLRHIRGVLAWDLPVRSCVRHDHVVPNCGNEDAHVRISELVSLDRMCR